MIDKNVKQSFKLNNANYLSSIFEGKNVPTQTRQAISQHVSSSSSSLCKFNTFPKKSKIIDHTKFVSCEVTAFFSEDIFISV